MGASNSPSDKNNVNSGTLRPPAIVEDMHRGVDSSIRDHTPSGEPIVVLPNQALPILPNGKNDPLATALFESDEQGGKIASADKASSGPTAVKSIHSDAPDQSPDQYRKIEEVTVRIPGFTIRGELGRGAFGIVYRAYDEMLDRDVAVKVPILHDLKLQKQYIDEARKAVKLEHPGIVPTYHVGVSENGQPFVVQKLIEGTTLRALLKERGGALSLGEAIGILRPICLALESAHASGLIHRDLKPENLLIDHSGRPYVADFGLAVSDDEDLSGRTEVAGTPLYMSPEQFSGRTQWLDGRSDIWALGVIFYETLVGKVPFYAESIRELRDQVMEKDPRPIHQRQPNIPVAFDAIFRKCCAKQTSGRFGSVRELIDAIDEAIDGLPEQSILQLMPELHRSSKGRRSSSNQFSSDGFSQKRRLSSGGYSISKSSVRTPGRFVRVWNMLGPLIAVACTISAVVLMYNLPAKDQPKTIEPKQAEASEQVATLGASVPTELASSAELTKIATKSDVLNTTAITPNARIQTTLNTSEMKAIPPATVLTIQKPFKVSRRTGEGTHETLSAAIANSEAGDTIIVLEGTYREPLILDKNIKLVGQGDKNNVILQTEGESCLVVRNNASVELDNIKLKTNGSGSKEANTVDIESGELRLKKCFVVSNSFDCVKLRNDTRLIATNSDFQSSEHATIRAEIGSSIDVESCNFILHPDSPDSKKKVCIQGDGALGKISNCRFIGPCMAGIEWRDQKSGRLSIEQCSFSDIKLGVSLTSCKDVFITGSRDSPLTLKNCDDSIWIRDSTVNIEGAKIIGNRNNLRKGIAVEKNSNVRISGSLVSGFESGVAVDHSTIVVIDTAIRDSVDRNFRAQSSNVTLEDVDLVGGGPNGLHLSGQESSLTFTGGLVSKSTSGLWIESGTALLNQVLVSDCTAAVIAGINAETAIVFSDPSSDARDAKQLNGIKDSRVKISGTGLIFSGCAKGFVFMSPGDLAMTDVTDDFATDSKKRLSILSTEVSGVGDYSNFQANWKSIRERNTK